MNIIYIALIISYSFSLLIQIIEKENKKLLKYILIFFLITSIVFIAGTQINVGDTPVYRWMFNDIIQKGDTLRYDYDGGFTFFMKILTLISHDPQILIFACSLIIGGLNILYFLRYSYLLDLEIFLYITTGYYIVTMNGLRQCLAAAILIWFTDLIHKRKFMLYSIVIILLSFIHQSVLIMIPLYFIIILKPWSKKIFIIILFVFCGIFLFENLLPVLFLFLEGTNYTQYENYMKDADAGANVMRVLIATVPLVLAYIKRNFLQEKWERSYIYINTALLNFIFYLYATFNWIFARFAIYFQIYNIVLIAFLVKSAFPKKERRILYFLLIIFYLLFFWLEYSVVQKLEYISYFDWENIFFNIGG